MTPERIILPSAVWTWHDEYGWVTETLAVAMFHEGEMLDEIERLRAVIVNDHLLDDTEEGLWWCRCGERGDKARSHSAHVTQILEGKR